MNITELHVCSCGTCNEMLPPHTDRCHFEIEMNTAYKLAEAFADKLRKVEEMFNLGQVGKN